MPASFPRLGLLGALCSIVPLLHASEPTTDAALIEKGRYVAQLGDCIACHTGPQGAPMAGGLELKTPMGTIYSTNITPDGRPASAATASKSSTAPCARG